jgi:hypothetical protein
LRTITDAYVPDFYDEGIINRIDSEDKKKVMLDEQEANKDP